MRKILYISRSGIPDTAAGLRIYNVAKIFRDLEYEVLFYCDKPDYEKDTLIQYDDFNYHYATNYKNSKYSIVPNINELVFASKSIRKIKRLIYEFNPDVVVLYNDIYSITKRLIKMCDDENIKLIADVTEWYGKRKSTRIADKIIPLLVNYRIKTLDEKVKNIISITPYLEDYYVKKNCNTMVLPPVFDIEGIKVKKYDYYSHRVINLVYAGVPGNKDIINPILNAIESFNSSGIKIRIDLVGIDEDYLIESWKQSGFKNSGIFAHGRLPHHQTLEIVKKADFGVLFRHSDRYAKAGFSTKYSECMSNGVAMICNSVGGADLFINNMEDGIVIECVSEDLVIKTLTNIYEMNDSEIIQLRENAYSKSCDLFERKAYINEMESFLKSLK